MRLSILFLGEEMTEFSCEASVFKARLECCVSFFFDFDSAETGIDFCGGCEPGGFIKTV